MDKGTDVSGSGKRHVDAELVQEPHLGGLRLQLESGLVVDFRPNSERKLPSDTEGRFRGKQLQHFLELEDTNCVLIHRPQA